MQSGSYPYSYSSSDFTASIRDAIIAAIAAGAAYLADKYQLTPEVQAAIVTLGVFGMKTIWKYMTDTRRVIGY